VVSRAGSHVVLRISRDRSYERAQLKPSPLIATESKLAQWWSGSLVCCPSGRFEVEGEVEGHISAPTRGRVPVYPTSAVSSWRASRGFCVWVLTHGARPARIPRSNLGAGDLGGPGAPQQR
jgi:hypothetical protein